MARRAPLDVPEEAIEKYREFHRHAPERVGEFGHRFSVPEQVIRVGDARHVLYRSDKVDPETLRRPRRPIDYIHEHNAGVGTYLPVLSYGAYDRQLEVALRGAPRPQAVPEKFREIDTLVRLGTCLGFAFTRDSSDREAEAVPPMPDLYCTTDGRCLLVIQSRRQVLAMMWGGALGVFARGIDG